MKKLMFAMAAVAAGSVFADITSANIVGYAENNLRNGFSATGPQFVSVDGKGIDIQSITPKGEDLSNVQIQTLNFDGTGNESFAWDDWQYEESPCWADENGPATKKFVPGEGMWFQGVDGYTFQTAGEVGQEDLVIALRNGFTMSANTFPVPVDIQDIVPEGEDLSNVQIQTLNFDGTGNESFAWDDWQYEESPCWADANGPATKKFAPGEGLWVQGADGYTLRIPAPEL